jgi:glycerophosphoryl diester phosphodiesterase
MRVLSWIRSSFLKNVDAIYQQRKHPRPAADRLQRCKIVSHRGEHDNLTVFENTLAAFEKVKAHGIWGLELDIRWTQDLRPVVIHDPDTRRLFHIRQRIDQLPCARLKESFSVIPTLEEVVQRYGRRLHLMIEIKAEPYPDPVRQNRVLKEHLAQLAPGEDYHLISLAPRMFDFFDFAPPASQLPIAELNIRRFSDLAVRKNFGGLLGHYLLLTNRMLKKHRAIGQNVGTGFVNSKNCLFREMNRHVEWIFSNNAVELQSILNPGLGNVAPAVENEVQQKVSHDQSHT